jgi:hypothetical protein
MGPPRGVGGQLNNAEGDHEQPTNTDGPADHAPAGKRADLVGVQPAPGPGVRDRIAAGPAIGPPALGPAEPAARPGLAPALAPAAPVADDGADPDRRPNGGADTITDRGAGRLGRHPGADPDDRTDAGSDATTYRGANPNPDRRSNPGSDAEPERRADALAFAFAIAQRGAQPESVGFGQRRTVSCARAGA